jgi:hypothetical protein
MMLRTVFSTLAILPALFAQVSPAPFFPQGEPLPDGKDSAVYSAPACVHVDTSWDLNFNAAFIYWYFEQDAMDLAYIAPSEAGGIGGKVAYPFFGYKPGFKIGLGFDTHFDDWMFKAEYTRLHQSETKIESSGLGYIPANWFAQPVAGPFGYVGSLWGVHLDIADVSVAKPYYEGKRAVVSPSLGARLLLLHQGFNIQMGSSFLGDANAIFTGHSHSWGLGPRGAVNAKVFLFKGLSLDALLGASILYTRFVSLSATQAQNGVVTSSSADIGAVKPTLDAGLGFGYSTYAFKNKFFFELSARYDFSQYWAQNVMREYASQLSGTAPPIGDLRIQGLTVNLSSHF